MTLKINLKLEKFGFFLISGMLDILGKPGTNLTRFKGTIVGKWFGIKSVHALLDELGNARSGETINENFQDPTKAIDI